MRSAKKDNKNKDKTNFRKRTTNFKKKTCPFEGGVLKIDYKDPRTLQKFISERGKIMPCRISMVSARKQRALAIAVKRARYLALLPYVAE
ncbi:MAG: 30S ribosomal protein S18 [Holosporaceae bacterium]|jgi:small subunit ribosomal protein S18|nr:30S ribosomal protein S18 [Holosporaceae bacterium]